MPCIQRVYSSLKKKELEVVAITTDRWIEGAKKYLVKLQITLPVALLSGISHQTCDRYGIAGVPTTYLLDSNGCIAWRQFDRLDEAELRLALKQLGVE